MEHAYAAAVDGDRREECEYLVRREPDGSVYVCVTDGGVWRPPPEDKGHRGRGLELIAALAVDVEIGPVPAPGVGTTVSFRLPALSEPAGVDGRPATGGRPPLTAITTGGPGAWSGDGAPARVSSHEGPAGLRLEISGELDLGTTAAAHDALLAALEGQPRGAIVELDLTATSYLASAGVGMILQLVGEGTARGIELRLLSAEGSATARVFALTGLGGLLEAGIPAAPSSPVH